MKRPHLKRPRQKPINKEDFKKVLTATNQKRSLIAGGVLLFLTGMMFVSQKISRDGSSDPAFIHRADVLFSFSKIFLLLLVVLALFYFISKIKNVPSIFSSISTFTFYLATILFGATIVTLLFILDRQNFSTFYAVFTLFISLVLFIKPPVAFVTLTSVLLVSMFTMDLVPMTFDFTYDEALAWSVFAETILVVNILSFAVSTMLYNNFVRDYNKTYTIEALNQELIKSLKTDSLTEIYNRLEFTNQLIERADRAKNENKALSVTIIDIDYFKQYNDTYGHLKGDLCLKSVAQCIKKSICEKVPDAVVARYGGEEFTAIIPDLEPEEAFKIFESCLEDVRKMEIEHSASSISPIVTISAGVSSIREVDNIDPAKLLNHADKLLYKAKNTGRNRMVAEIFTEA